MDKYVLIDFGTGKVKEFDVCFKAIRYIENLLETASSPFTRMQDLQLISREFGSFYYKILRLPFKEETRIRVQVKDQDP